MITILSTWSTLETVKDTVLDGKIGALTSVAVVIAAILAAASILKVSRDYISGHGNDLWSLIRPIVLLILVCQFDSFVLRPLDSTINVFTRDIAASVDMSTSEYVSKWSSNMVDLGDHILQSNKEKMAQDLMDAADRDTWFGRFFYSIWGAIKKTLMDRFCAITFTIEGVVGGVLFLFVKILLFIQQLLCCAYQIINALLGPFAVALAILPSFESGIKTWVARYIQIAMWVPIGYIIMYINLEIGTAFCNMAENNGADLSMQWFMIALQIVALITVAAVPKIAAWVIESTGANDAHGSMSQPARTIGRKLVKF